MSDPTPVPLDEIEAVKAEGRRLREEILSKVDYRDAVNDFVAFMIDHPETLAPAPTEALRIAVEGLAAVRERSDDPVACATSLEGEWAVRELVDLGEKP